MMVPVDTTAATRIYSYTVHYADATARQRGQMPTPMSSIETSGDSYWSQFEEAIYSPRLRLRQRLRPPRPPRMVTHSPTHEVRYFPESFWARRHRSPPPPARRSTPSRPPSPPRRSSPHAESRPHAACGTNAPLLTPWLAAAPKTSRHNPRRRRTAPFLGRCPSAASSYNTRPR